VSDELKEPSFRASLLMTYRPPPLREGKSQPIPIRSFGTAIGEGGRIGDRD
jgi:hypothetical protein